MRGIGCFEFGPPDVLRIVELHDLEPGPEQVRVRVHAATVNPADTQYRLGKYVDAVPDAVPPFVGGLEFSGTVDRVGAGAPWREGDRVIGMTTFIPHGRGCHAEQVVVHGDSVVPLPPDADPVAFATVPMSGLTARMALDRLALPSGTTIAITGAAGAVGAYAVQLAARDGLAVIAIASLQDEDFVRECGAEIFIPRGDDLSAAIRDVAPEGVPGLLDTAVIGDALAGALTEDGRIASFKPYQPELYPSAKVEVISVRQYLRQPDKLRELADLASSGQLRLRVSGHSRTKRRKRHTDSLRREERADESSSCSSKRQPAVCPTCSRMGA